MKQKIAIAGCGKLAQVIVKAAAEGLLPQYEIAVAYSRSREKAGTVAAIAREDGNNCVVADSYEALLDNAPDIVVEIASPAAMREWALPTLRRGISIITLSIGAFADDDFYKEVMETAKAHNAKVYIASGATGGFDVLQTTTLMGGVQARFFNEKSPNALRNTPVYNDNLQKKPTIVFEGSAKEAINLFPTKVNVTVAASRASVGPEKMHVTIKSTPGFTGDTQKVEIENEQVHATVDVYSSTSEIAAWSVVSVLRNIASSIVFF